MAELEKGRATPLVSIIVATYNRGSFIAKAIDSVLAQTFRDFELIIIDDGSTDRTCDLVTAYGDSRIVYKWIEHGERSRARNIGIRLSRGKYIAFLDSDDWYLPEKLALQVAALEKHPSAGLSLGGWAIVDERGDVIRHVRPWKEISVQPTLEEWLFATTMTPITMTVKKEWLERVGGFDADLTYFEDVELCIRLALAGCPVVWVTELVAVVLSHGANSLRNLQELKRGQNRFLTKIFTFPDFDSNLRISKEEVFAGFHLSLAWRAYHNGLVEQGMEELVQAVALCPRLEQREFEEIRNSIVAYSSYYLVSDPIHFVKQVFQNLPSSLAPLGRYRRAVLGRTWMSRAWRVHRYGKFALARQSVFHAIWYTPSCLRNRGIRSLLFQSLVGQRVWRLTSSVLYRASLHS